MARQAKVVFICGYICAGKSTMAERLAKGVTDAKFVEVSDIVREIRSDLVTRKELQQTPELDVDIITSIYKLQKTKHLSTLYVIGARQVSILRAFPNAEYIWIEVPEDARYARFSNRSTNKDLDTSREAFNAAEQRDRELGAFRVKQFIFNQSY